MESKSVVNKRAKVYLPAFTAPNAYHVRELNLNMLAAAVTELERVSPGNATVIVITSNSIEVEWRA